MPSSVGSNPTGSFSRKETIVTGVGRTTKSALLKRVEDELGEVRRELNRCELKLAHLQAALASLRKRGVQR